MQDTGYYVGKKLPRTNLFLIITFQRSLQNTHKTSVK